MTTANGSGSATDNRWRISLRQGLVLVEFKPGTVLTSEMIKTITSALNAQPEKYRTTNAIWDMRHVAPGPETGFNEVFQVKEHIQTHWQSWWTQSKLALLTANKASYGMSRMFASLAESSLEYKVRIFKDDLQAAIEWAQAPD